MNAIAKRKPITVWAIEVIDVALPAELEATVEIRVGLFPRRGEELPGWRAEVVTTSLHTVIGHSGARERSHAVLDAVDMVINRLVDIADKPSYKQRRRLQTVIDALTSWSNKFAASQTKKESTAMTVSTKKILNSKECNALLEDFRVSYQTCMHSFLALGEKAETIFEQEAYADLFAKYDDWIKAEGYGHTFIYDCRKAWRISKLIGPTAEPRRLLLDCESHYRDIPADVTAKEAKAIVSTLIENVEPDADGAAEADTPAGEGSGGGGAAGGGGGEKSGVSSQKSEGGGEVSGQRSEVRRTGTGAAAGPGDDRR